MSLTHSLPHSKWPPRKRRRKETTVKCPAAAGHYAHSLDYHVRQSVSQSVSRPEARPSRPEGTRGEKRVVPFRQGTSERSRGKAATAALPRGLTSLANEIGCGLSFSLSFGHDAICGNVIHERPEWGSKDAASHRWHWRGAPAARLHLCALGPTRAFINLLPQRGREAAEGGRRRSRNGSSVSVLVGQSHSQALRQPVGPSVQRYSQPFANRLGDSRPLSMSRGRARPLRPLLHSRGNGRIRVMMMRANTGSDARDREGRAAARLLTLRSRPPSLSLLRSLPLSRYGLFILRYRVSRSPLKSFC